MLGCFFSVSPKTKFEIGAVGASASASARASAGASASASAREVATGK